MTELRDIKPPYLEIIELIRKHRKSLLGKTGPTPIPLSELREITSTQYINDCLKQLVQDNIIGPCELVSDETEGAIIVDCLKTIEEMYEYRLSLQYEIDPVVNFPVTSWELLEIRFITELEVLLTAEEPTGNRRMQCAFNSLGFEHKQSKQPIQSWQFLTLLAIRGGQLDTSGMTASEKAKAKVEKKALKKHLQRVFRLDTDPFYPFSHNKQYELKCKIEYMTTE